MKIDLKCSLVMDMKGIDDDLKKFRDAFGITVAKKATQMIYKFAQEEIAGYYGEYPPIMYTRENEAPDQMKNYSFAPYTGMLSNKGIYEGGIIFDPGFVDHVVRGISEEQIFENVWDLGVHGRHATFKMHSGNAYLSTVEIIQGTPNRFGAIVEKVNSDSFKKDLINAGFKAARQQKYSILKFTN